MDLIQNTHRSFRWVALLFTSLLCLMACNESLTEQLPATGTASSAAEQDLNAGEDAQEAGNYDAAITYYSRALSEGGLTDDDRIIAYNNRGLDYSSKKMYEKALDDFGQVLMIRPNEPDALINRSIVYRTLEKYELALNDLNVVLNAKPDSVEALNDRGYVFRKMKVYQKALADFNRAISLAPNTPAPYNNRALTYMDLGRFDDAVHAFNDLIKMDPDHGATYNNRGKALQILGHYRESIADFDTSLQLEPDFIGAYLNRALSHFMLDEHGQAIGDLEHLLATSEYSGDPQSIIYLYLSRERAGQDGKAELRKLADATSNHSWPYPIIEYYLDKITLQQLIEQTQDPDRDIQADKVCLDWTFVGERDLLAKDRTSAMQHFRQTVETCPSLQINMVARSELSRLSGMQ